jgi:hypothetical protein
VVTVNLTGPQREVRFEIELRGPDGFTSPLAFPPGIDVYERAVSGLLAAIETGQPHP